MEPSGSFEPAELKLTLRGAVPDVGVADATATGGVFGVPVGNTNSVMLCAGAVNDAVLPLKPKSASLVIAFAAVNWYTCAVPLLAKLFSAMLTGVLPDKYLLITITVRAL